MLDVHPLILIFFSFLFFCSVFVLISDSDNVKLNG